MSVNFCFSPDLTSFYDGRNNYNVSELVSLYERDEKDAHHNGKTIFIYLVSRIILSGTKSLKSNKLANLLQWYDHWSIKYMDVV